jgi:hypothetical protein
VTDFVNVRTLELDLWNNPALPQVRRSLGAT